MLGEADLQFDAMVAALTAPGQQFEVTTAEIRGASYKVFKNAPKSVAEYLGLALMHQDKTFIVYEGERYSYGESYKRAHALAAHLRDVYGVKLGDKVVLVMRNYPEWIFVFMAIQLLGAVAVPLNAWWVQDELIYAFKDSGATLAIVDGARAERFSAILVTERPRVLVVRAEFDLPDGMDRLEDQVFLSGAMTGPLKIDPDADASILYTSGSTGEPKGAVATQRSYVTALMNFAVAGLAQMELDKKAGRMAGDLQPAVLLSVPLFHVTGLVPVCLVSFLIGRKLVMMHKWDAHDAFRFIDEEKINYFVGVPTMSLELLQHPDRERFDLSTLADLGGGGAARPAEHVKRLKEAFPQARPGIGYGLTETIGVGATNSREGYLARPTSTGRATKPMVDLAILDEAGLELPQGDVGEIALRSAALVRGYWNKAEATYSAFDSRGWFRSGDLGYLDEDGYLFIVDRKKDIIIRGGENISCLEVEAALYHHEDVAEATVFGLPDERLGETVGAVVFPKQGVLLNADNLKNYVGQHLAAFKVPVKLWVSAQPLPKLGSGKIDKMQLRKHYV